MASRIRKNDTVQVMAGKDRGKTGEILQVFPTQNRVTVRGLNMVKRHIKPNQQQQQGGIVEKEAPLHISNVMPLDPEDGRPTRVGFRIVEGKKVRVSKRTGKVLD
ncbi:MAG: 50S ribosomal protein L24 [Desulfurellaceae bacterium]|nr:50S ribosomal protein L24 [Desulfurellaceae bacterium]